MPAILVCAERIRQDLEYNLHPEIKEIWDLPEDLRPEEEDCGLPTKNLLGWGRAMALPTEQRMTLERTGVDGDNFPVTNTQCWMNKPLFERTGNFVRKAEVSVKLGASVHESANGSLSQILWVERDVQMEANYDRFEQYKEREIRVFKYST
jgi:hypothetical protein